MKHVGREVAIDPYDRHYWAQRFFAWLKDRGVVNARGEISVNRLVRQLVRFCKENLLDHMHMMHFMLNERYVLPTAEAVYTIQWEKVK